MWEEVCLREHRLSGPTEILECRLAPERVELFSGGSVTQLGLVAEGEQRLAAAGRCAGASDVEDLVDAQVCPLASARRAGEGAVVTDVATELRQRDEDLWLIRDEPAVALVSQRSRFRTELVERPGQELHQGSLDPAQLVRPDVKFRRAG